MLVVDSFEWDAAVIGTRTSVQSLQSLLSESATRKMEVLESELLRAWSNLITTLIRTLKQSEKDELDRVAVLCNSNTAQTVLDAHRQQFS